MDLHRRFVQMYGNVVLGVERGRLEDVTQDRGRRAGVSRLADLGCDPLNEVVTAFQTVISEETCKRVPDDPCVQLECAIIALFESWNNRRAVDYRNVHGVSQELGTAVNVVTMVNGNIDDECCTGACFTRNPATGKKQPYGEYPTNAQGEDVVAGTSTPHDIWDLAAEMPGGNVG